MTTTTDNNSGLIYARTGHVDTDIMGTPRGEGFDLQEVVIATYLDLSTGEVFLKTFESASFGAGVPAAEAWADYASLTLVSTVAGETNLTMGSVSAWVRR